MTADQNREIVQKIYAYFGAGDLPGLLALQADDVVWRFPDAPAVPYAGEYRGKDGVTEFFGKLMSTAAFEAFEVSRTSPPKATGLSSTALSGSAATPPAKPPTTPGPCTGPSATAWSSR